MVLVDASVWIRGLAGRTPFRKELDCLLELEEVVAHEFVYGELLIGDKGGRAKLLTAYGQLPFAARVTHENLVRFVRDRHLEGVGWIDIHLLASALAGRFRLWTTDARLDQLANRLGVAYRFG